MCGVVSNGRKGGLISWCSVNMIYDDSYDKWLTENVSCKDDEAQVTTHLKSMKVKQEETKSR